VRQLFPVYIDPVDPVDVYGQMPEVTGRPAVRLNMIASVDGGTAISGVSRGLGGLADHELFFVLRSVADVIVVGAGTARAERYGPSKLPASLQDARSRRGQTPLPPIAVLTRSCQLEWEAPFFTTATARPIVITVSDATAANRARAAEVADVILAGSREVELARALDSLGERGARFVLVEGGPTVNGQLALAGLLDELCLTVSPRLLSGDSKRIMGGAPLSDPTRLELASICEQDDFVFLRLRPAGAAPG
jgi:riboflavin biosynthesis pyrimidine reductase